MATPVSEHESTDTAPEPGSDDAVPRRAWGWLWDRLGWLRRWSGRQLWPILWANLVMETVIIVTGGLVRVTGSGLGCPTWPQCVEGSLVPTAAQSEGVHKFIEFGNRTLTGVLGVLALLAVIAVLERFPQRPRMRWSAWALLGGVLSQAVVGGITVRTGLNPFIVAFHFLCSILMVAICVILLRGARDEHDGPGEALVPPLVRRLGWLTSGLGAVVITLGAVVTGSGPHSGDAATPARTGFDPRFVSWMHADAVMLFAGLVVAMVVATMLVGQTKRPAASWRFVLLVVIMQGFIGYLQYFTALPAVLVLLHMLGSAVLTIALTAGMLSLRHNPV